MRSTKKYQTVRVNIAASAQPINILMRKGHTPCYLLVEYFIRKLKGRVANENTSTQRETPNGQSHAMTRVKRGKIRTNFSKEGPILRHLGSDRAYSLKNRWSINCYPAAQHKDYFKSTRAQFSGLENKICLSSKKLYSVFGPGRGGKGKEPRLDRNCVRNSANKFVFCLLDWASGQRTVDGERISRRDIMVRYDGNAPLRIRQEVWLAFVHTNANQLLGDRTAQHLLRDGPTQQMLAQARDGPEQQKLAPPQHNPVIDGEELVNM